MDLCTKIPFMSLPEKRRNELWDDGVHFTHAGYDLMGTFIGKRLVEIITAKMNEGGEEGAEDTKEEIEKAGSRNSELKKRGDMNAELVE
jgi:hypothetical protein